MLPFLANTLPEIQVQLNNLTQLAEKMSKFDWANLFVGTIISIVIQLSITPDNAKTLWGIIKGIFTGYFLN